MQKKKTFNDVTFLVQCSRSCFNFINKRKKIFRIISNPARLVQEVYIINLVYTLVYTLV